MRTVPRFVAVEEQRPGARVLERAPPQPVGALRARFGDRLRIAPYLGAFWLGLNLTQPPLRDAPALRRALALAVDRDKLTRHITGLGETPAYGVVPPGIAGYTPAQASWSALDQHAREALARRLYAQAGYSRGKPLVLELRYNTSTPHRRLALAVAAMWR